MSKESFQYISSPYKSNCFLEAIKAKMKNKSIKLYFCKPGITENGRFQMAHFLWSDGKADYDFADDESKPLPWHKCFWFTGRIRCFPYGFAKKYSEYRNRTKLRPELMEDRE